MITPRLFLPLTLCFETISDLSGFELVISLKSVTTLCLVPGVQKTEKVLVILDSPSEVIKKSINNIEKVKLIAADQLNVFDILNANKLVIGQSAIDKIQEVYAS